jgi:hypothetical protein
MVCLHERLWVAVVCYSESLTRCRQVLVSGLSSLVCHNTFDMLAIYNRHYLVWWLFPSRTQLLDEILKRLVLLWG